MAGWSGRLCRRFLDAPLALGCLMRRLHPLLALTAFRPPVGQVADEDHRCAPRAHRARLIAPLAARRDNARSPPTGKASATSEGMCCNRVACPAGAPMWQMVSFTPLSDAQLSLLASEGEALPRCSSLRPLRATLPYLGSADFCN